MRNRTLRLAAMTIVVALTLLCGSRFATAAEPITPQQLDRLRAEIPPAPSEQKWTQIPWLTSLWEARRQAAAQGKPILLWEMDGHPLGCV